jgi:hypothetical protein
VNEEVAQINENGSYRSNIFAIAVALGVTLITGIVGWTFANMIANGIAISQVEERQLSGLAELKDHEIRIRKLEEELYQYEYRHGPQ